MTQRELMTKLRDESLKNPNIKRRKREPSFDILKRKDSCLYIHIPKTGGRYLRKLLKIEGINYSTPGHKGALFVENRIDNFDDKFSFACVRNPYERFLSACVFNGLRDFEKVSNQVLEGNVKAKYPVHFDTQKSFVANEEGVIIIKYIGRFEKFNEFIEGLKERGIDVTSKHEFKKPRSSDWETRLTEKTKENIRKIYKEDFELFNYDM